MNRTYQPFIIEKADQILDVLKDEVQPTEQARERLCMMLTQKFIDGKLSADDEIDSIFESEDEILKFINQCYIRENLIVLMEKGLIGVYEDDDNEELFFLTEQGKLYMEKSKFQGSGVS